MKQVQYFAYGSNVNQHQFKRERSISFTHEEKATLQNYKLVFNKRGVIYMGYAAANIIYKRGFVTEGIVYTMSEVQFSTLDTFEVGYGKEVVELTLMNDSIINAYTYIALPEFIAHDLLPSAVYLNKIITGGKDLFSKEYLEELHKWL